jgi:hypothetical protein
MIRQAGGTTMPHAPTRWVRLFTALVGTAVLVVGLATLRHVAPLDEDGCHEDEDGYYHCH